MVILDIEGTDGSGKATQTKLLHEYLTKSGFKTKVISFPDYNSPGSAPVKMYLAGELNQFSKINGYQASVLFAVDRLVTMQKQNLAEYDVVIMDRYTYSNMIHQSTQLKTKAEINKFLNWVNKFEFKTLNLPKPDLTLFLDVPAEISFELAKNRGELKNQQTKDILEQDFNHIKTAHDRAEYVANKFKWIKLNCTANGKIKSIEQIHDEIKGKLTPFLNKLKKEEL